MPTTAKWSRTKSILLHYIIYDSKRHESYISIVDAQKVHVLGTPEELEEFLNA